MLASYVSSQNNDGVKFGWVKKIKNRRTGGGQIYRRLRHGGRPKKKKMNSCNSFDSRKYTAVIPGPVLFESVPAANKTQIRHGDISMFFLIQGGVGIKLS